MRLLGLRVRDFRNIEEADLRFASRATVIFGPNGHGKTNLLEAIYLLATLRPLRASRLRELPRFGEERCEVQGEWEVGPVCRVASVTVEGGARTAWLDGKKTRDLESYFGGIAVVAFTPDDLAVVKGGPELRRRHLDRSVFNRFPAFLSESREYARALKSRNRLLKEGAPRPVIEAFDAPFARAAARLVARRRAFLGELAEGYSKALSALTHGQLRGEVRYLPQPAFDEDEGAFEAALLKELAGRLPRERERGFTSLGPHADRLSFLLDGRPARSYASQGQQRAMVLAWKIAEIENLRDRLGFQPLLLLDDVSSELDPERNRQLLHYLGGFDGQVILTTTDPSQLVGAAGPSASYLAVRDGTFQEVGPEAAARGSPRTPKSE